MLVINQFLVNDFIALIARNSQDIDVMGMTSNQRIPMKIFFKNFIVSPSPQDLLEMQKYFHAIVHQAYINGSSGEIMHMVNGTTFNEESIYFTIPVFFLKRLRRVNFDLNQYIIKFDLQSKIDDIYV